MVAALFLARQPQVQLHRLTHMPEPIGNRTSLEVKSQDEKCFVPQAARWLLHDRPASWAI